MSLCVSLSQRSVCDCNKRILHCIVLYVAFPSELSKLHSIYSHYSHLLRIVNMQEFCKFYYFKLTSKTGYVKMI